MSRALARALEGRRKAQDIIDKVLKRDYPSGTEVAWKRNGIHEGTVVFYGGFGDRIKVRNAKTGRELWIHAYCIVDAMESMVLTK